MKNTAIQEGRRELRDIRRERIEEKKVGEKKSDWGRGRRKGVGRKEGRKGGSKEFKKGKRNRKCIKRNERIRVKKEGERRRGRGT